MARQRRLASAGLIVAGLAAGLLIGEIGLRIIGFSSPSFFHAHPVLGWGNRPGAEGPWTLDGGAHVRINSRGLRDREHVLPKPDDVARIAFLGDSMTAAFQVPAEQGYVRRVETLLSRCDSLGGKRVETVNLAVPGHGTAQALLMVRHFVWDYAPDMVVLAFFAGNDVRNNSNALDGDSQRPYFEISDGAMVLDDAFRSTTTYRLRMSRLAKMLYPITRNLRASELIRAVKRKWVLATREKRQGLAPSGIDKALYSAPRTTEWRSAWEVTEAMIMAIDDEVRSRGARFGLLAITDGVQVHPDPALRDRLQRQWQVDSWIYPDQRLQRVAATTGISYLSLVGRLRARAEAERVYLHGFDNALPGFGHWNRKGHEIAAVAIADWICPAI